MISFLVCVLSSCLILSGCVLTSNFSVYIDGIADHSVHKKVYTISPKDKDIGDNDLLFREFSSYVRRALLKNGYVEASDPQRASILILLDYGISDPQVRQETYSVPVKGRVGGDTSTTSGMIYSNGRYSYYSGVKKTKSIYGTIGYETKTKTKVSYLRYMTLNAIDLDKVREKNEYKPIWSLAATSTGRSGNLRRVFPVLVAASFPYIGANTGQRVKRRLGENDSDVIMIRGYTIK